MLVFLNVSFYYCMFMGCVCACMYLCMAHTWSVRRQLKSLLSYCYVGSKWVLRGQTHFIRLVQQMLHLLNIVAGPSRSVKSVFLGLTFKSVISVP